MKLKQTYWCWT